MLCPTTRSGSGPLSTSSNWRHDILSPSQSPEVEVRDLKFSALHPKSGLLSSTPTSTPQQNNDRRKNLIGGGAFESGSREVKRSKQAVLGTLFAWRLPTKCQSATNHHYLALSIAHALPEDRPARALEREESSAFKSRQASATCGDTPAGQVRGWLQHARDGMHLPFSRLARQSPTCPVTGCVLSTR